MVYTATGEHTPKDIHHSWKSYTAHEANKILRKSGTFWESEGFDHLIRSVDDLEWFIEYTENNPVAAGLCATNGIPARRDTTSRSFFGLSGGL